MSTIRLPAPAKINRFLRITGRRPDGYHNLQTVFQYLDWSDELEFTLRQDHELTLTCKQMDMPPASNLVYRAAIRLQQEHRGSLPGVDIVLDKNLPMGAGLGGGSSDAATTLVALNRLWGLGLDRQALQEIALELGADVPFFVYGRTAFAEGVGECLTAVEMTEQNLVVLYPSVMVNTAEIFASAELTRDASPLKMCDLLGAEPENHCMPVVLRHYPEVKRAFQWMARFGTPQLSGTGSCLFLVVASDEMAREIADAAPEPWCARASRSVNRSSLYD